VGEVGVQTDLATKLSDIAYCAVVGALCVLAMPIWLAVFPSTIPAVLAAGLVGFGAGLLRRDK
jgi:hypothetical protein